MRELLKTDHLSCGYGDRPVRDGDVFVACHKHYMVHARSGMCGRACRRNKSVFYTLQNISDIYRTSSGGVNGARGEVALPEGARKPLKNKEKSTLREQDASRPRAGEGRGANASDGGVFGGVNALLELVRENPGLRANALADLSGKGRRTFERYLGALVLLKQVELGGAPESAFENMKSERLVQDEK